jgi:hypothetical protein
MLIFGGSGKNDADLRENERYQVFAQLSGGGEEKMRGGFRIRKKNLKQAGWQVVGDSKAEDVGYQLVLKDAGGNEMTIQASTRARAFRRAESELLSRGEPKEG